VVAMSNFGEGIRLCGLLDPLICTCYGVTADNREARGHMITFKGRRYLVFSLIACIWFVNGLIGWLLLKKQKSMKVGIPMVKSCMVT
jgi:hypothetical protein